MDGKKIGKRIKLARIEHDMTQIQLAEAIESNQRSVSRYESGLALPTLDVLEKLSKVLNKPYSYFLE